MDKDVGENASGWEIGRQEKKLVIHCWFQSIHVSENMWF